MINLFLQFIVASATSLDTLIDQSPVLKGASFGVTVTRFDGTLLYDRNGDRRLVPASNQKVLSAVYAAHYLGLDYHPITLITERSDAIGVQSPGDPSLTAARLRQAAAQLSSRNKPVYVSQAYAPGVPGGWEADDLINRYAAPVYAFTVDQGAFRVESVLGVVQPLPSEFGVSMLRGQTSGPVSVRYDLEKQRVTIAGALGADTKTLETLALRRPDQSAARFLGLMKLDGMLPRSNETGKRTELRGDPMPKLMADCLQPSDNQYAEHLLLMTTAKRGLIKDPASPYPAARQNLHQFLTTVVGAERGDFRPMDGSGLARQNLLTSRGLAKVLEWSVHQPWFSTFDTALAAPGVGTLRSRLSGSSFRGKTGTLTGVVSLSGYVETVTKERVIVAVVINNTVDSSAKVREIADQIVRWVETSPGFGPSLVYSDPYERSPIQDLLPHPRVAAPARHRVSGFGVDGRPAFPWAHRRDEPAHETDH